LITIQGLKILVVLKSSIARQVNSSNTNLYIELFLSMKKKALYTI